MTTLGIGTLKVKGIRILFSYPKFGTNRQTDRQTDTTMYRVAPQLKKGHDQENEKEVKKKMMVKIVVHECCRQLTA